MVGLSEGRVMRVAVPLVHGNDLYNLGSGYLIADGMVLTAAHVLTCATGEAALKGGRAGVALLGGEWREATIAWVDARRDVAVLRCPGLRAEGVVRWGRLVGADPLDWGAVGFPRASLDQEAGRQPEHAYGRTSPISERPAGRLALTVESREATDGDSPWAGLSGAAVFSDEHLIGVITADPGRYARSLVGRRAEDFCADRELAELLGGPPALEDITGKVREPGLADLRSTLRSRNAAFTGRERDLAALSAGTKGRTLLTQSLVGLGGVGKSALALEYAHRQYSAKELDVAWWFVAEDRSVLLASMANLYARLTGNPRTDEDAEQGAMALRNWLERCPYRWLVVFDNAEPGTVDGILPENGTGQVIITSRVSNWLGVDTTSVVGRLALGEAITLLAEITGLTSDDNAKEIAEELGGLALAIEQAAAYIRQIGTGYEDYLDALRADPQTVFGADLALTESVTARVWRRSLDRVTGGWEDHPAAHILGVISYLAPDDIPRQLFNPHAIGNVSILSALSPAALAVGLGELTAYSLIAFDRDSNAIHVHRVVQHLTRLNAESRGRAGDYCGAAIGLLDASSSEAGAEKVPVQRLLVHVATATTHAELIGAAPAHSANLLNEIALILVDIGQLDTTSPLLDRASRIAQAYLDPNHPATLTTRSSQASLLGQTGRAEEAVKELDRLLGDRARVLGPDHPDTLTTRNDRAYWLGEAGRAEAAVKAFDRLLVDRARVLGPDHPDTLKTRSNRAFWLGRGGRAEEAADEVERLLADQERVLGADHPDTLSTRNNRAYWLGEGGRAEEAADELERLLADQERVLGPDHPATLTTRTNRASFLSQAGWVKRAIGELEQLLADRMRVLGPDHPATLTTRYNLASLLSQAGWVEEAIDEFQQLLADQERVLGFGHPATLTSRDELASLLDREAASDPPRSEISDPEPTRSDSRSLSASVRRGALWVVAQNLLLRLANVLLTAIVAHILSPHDFGVFAVALTAFVIVSSLAELGVSSCLLRADLDIDTLAPTVATIALVSNAILAFAMAAFAVPIATALGSAAAAGPIRVMSLAMLLNGVLAVPNAQLMRDFKQDKIFLANAIAFVPSSVLLILLAKSGSGAMAFAWSRVASQAAMACVLIAVAPRHYRPGLARSALSVILRFGIPLAGANLVNYVLLNVDYAFVGHFLGAAELGVYVLAFTLASAPYSLLGSVINNVAMPGFSRVKHDAALLKSAMATGLRAACLIALPICAMTMVLARPLVLTIYGEKWAASADVLVVLSLYGAVFIICLLFANMLAALGQTKSLLQLQLIWIGALVPVMMLGIYKDGIVGAAYAHVAVIVCIVLPSYLLMLKRATGVRVAALGKATLPALLGSSAAALATTGVASQVGSSAAQLVSGLAVGSVAYLACTRKYLVATFGRTRAIGADASFISDRRQSDRRQSDRRQSDRRQSDRRLGGWMVGGVGLHESILRPGPWSPPTRAPEE
jgi:PST family polysaccharide transporter